ncbi:hypothetical protein CG723_15200 [Streptomyces sp. CB01635]|uniref:DUF6571 family protein n=1 Tax=unclassified Streptomyces TaxID=2593676 RepID=UPI000C27E1E2|nr:DUF6571 family protein [Streptomyces sp. CB01635]PJN10565.1 hypothetical protein CG723_15200 [Streptomyces sp. CB01635]
MAEKTMTAQELSNLRLGTLDTAVSDWETMSKRLDTLSTGGHGEVSAKDLEAKANEADWKGVNATVSREFVTKTAVEFQDVAGEAASVLGILKDAGAAFKQHKTDLRTAESDLTKRNLHVDAKGGVVRQEASGAAGVGGIHATDEEIEVAQHRITRILWEASETDRIAARALRKLAKSKYDFTGDGPQGLKEADARQGKEDAEYWAKRIKEGDVKDWSDADLRRYNETLKNQRDNPGFTETFATTLGADGTLQFWRDLAAPPGGAVDGDRAKILAEVQDNLSMSLANATHSDSPAMETWKREVVAAGDKPFPIQGLPMGPNGFQVMSSLMGKGKFDGDFMHDYGNAMLKYEREYPGDPKVAWRDSTNLNYPPTDEPNDPVAGFMEGLGHNPEASLKFFDDSTTVDGKKLDNWDYLVAKGDDAREWPLGDDGNPIGHDALGHALESATIGVPYGSDATPPKHSAESAELVNRIVQEFGTNPEQLDDSPMSDSFGNITAEYMRDVQDGLNGEGGIATYGSNANLEALADDGTLKRFLGEVGKDPDAYGAIINSQQAVSTELINGAFHDRDKLGDQLMFEVNNRVSPGAEIAGIMADSRTQAVYDQKIAEDAEFNKGVVTADKWAGRAIDTGLARFPVAGDAAGWVIGDIRESVVEHYTRDSSGEAQVERDKFLATQRSGSASAVYDATYTAATEAGVSDIQAKSMATTASEKVKDSYGQGQQ